MNNNRFQIFNYPFKKNVLCVLLFCGIFIIMEVIAIFYIYDRGLKGHYPSIFLALSILLVCGFICAFTLKLLFKLRIASFFVMFLFGLLMSGALASQWIKVWICGLSGFFTKSYTGEHIAELIFLGNSTLDKSKSQEVDLDQSIISIKEGRANLYTKFYSIPNGGEVVIMSWFFGRYPTIKLIASSQTLDENQWIGEGVLNAKEVYSNMLIVIEP